MKSRALVQTFAALTFLVVVSLLSFAQDAVLPVPISTKLDITLNTPLSTQFSQPGDQFTADVSDGPYKGAIIHGTVRSVSQSGHFKGSAELLLSFDRIVLRDGRRGKILAEVTQVYVHGDKVGNEGAIESSARESTPGFGRDWAPRLARGWAESSAAVRARPSALWPAVAQEPRPRRSARSSRWCWRAAPC